MKQGSYHLYLLLRREGEHAQIIKATCECAAGYVILNPVRGGTIHLFCECFTCRQSACCTQISAILHALVALHPMEFPTQQISNDSDDEEESVPVTSLACQWKCPKKRKESTMQISEVNFEKHVYGRTSKKVMKTLEEFDPRPEKYRGTAKENLKPLLESVRDQGLCISLLLDPKTHCWNEGVTSLPSTSTPQLLSISSLQRAVTEFLKSLEVSEDEARLIERKTVGQRDSPFWFFMRKYRITASKFGEVMRLKDGTRPDNLVLRIIQDKHFTSVATEWGTKNEPMAVKKYQEHCLSNGHTDLTVCPSGFMVSTKYPFLGATPDGAVYDPSSPDQPYGFLEVKCSMTRHQTKHAILLDFVAVLKLTSMERL